MSESTKTLVFLLVAGVLAGGAAVKRSSGGSVRPEAFDDQGKPFHPDFKDVSKALILEVWEFDQEPFRVQFKDGLWTLPSKHGYPADAEDQLAKTAAALVGVERTILRSTQEKDHARFGVVDPQAKSSLPAEGRGKRVILKGEGDKVLVDLIIGYKAGDESTPGGALEGESGTVYVRRADEKRIYGTKLDLELSTKFEEWIDTDLLHLDVAQITSVTNNGYQVDERELAAGRIRLIEGESTEFGKADDGAWVVAGMGDDEQASVAAVDSVVDTLKELTIVDVLPRKQAELHQAGFFVTQQGVYSNEGELVVDLDTGVTYVLRFGEAVPAPAGEEGLRRFMVITAQPNEPLMDEGEAKETNKTVRELNDRFKDWYYVISAKSFADLRPARKLLTEPKPAEEEPEPGHGPDDGHGHGPDDGHGHGEESPLGPNKPPKAPAAASPTAASPTAASPTAASPTAASPTAASPTPKTRPPPPRSPRRSQPTWPRPCSTPPSPRPRPRPPSRSSSAPPGGPSWSGWSGPGPRTGPTASTTWPGSATSTGSASSA
jgi:hypothetical protein